jgi:crotonobetainyl-CoA:carnitine CoA-transferase CaiB-like acyl-CoA transferase
MVLTPGPLSIAVVALHYRDQWAMERGRIEEILPILASSLRSSPLSSALTPCPARPTMRGMDSAGEIPQLGALHGIRVLEMGTLIAGPFAARLLGDLGAEIIKVEPPVHGDPHREWGAMTEAGSLWFAVQARNKRSVTIDLRTPEGQDLVRRLARGCDVLIENFRPGTLEKWGLGPERLRAENPRLIVVRISGFGQTGPYRTRPGFGNIAEAMGGIRYITGFPDRPPVRVGMSLADHVASLYAVIGALTALQSRQVTGQGQVVDVALTEGIFSLLQDALPKYKTLGQIQERTGNDLHQSPPSNVYETKDGVWMAISGNNNSIFARLMTAIGRPDLSDDPRLKTNPGRVEHARMLDEVIAEWAKGKTADEVWAILDAAEVPFGPVYNIADIANDPQYQAREMILDVPHPGFGSVAMPGIVPKLSDTPGEVKWPGPPLGADTDAVLRDLAGVTDEELARLRAEGVV